MTDLEIYMADKAPPTAANALIMDWQDVAAHPIHLRFELHPSRDVINAEMTPLLRSDDLRTLCLKTNAPIIKHSVLRVTALFESIFRPEDDLVLLIKEELRVKPDDYYVDSLIRAEQRAAIRTEAISGGVRRWVRLRREEVDYRKILEGIVHRELGREPIVPQLVFFVNLCRDIVFYVYDDRGCLALSNDTEKLMFLYHQFKPWIINGFMGHPAMHSRKGK